MELTNYYETSFTSLTQSKWSKRILTLQTTPRFGLFLMLLIVLPYVGKAEKECYSLKPDSLLANEYFQKALVFQDSAYYDSALFYLENATEIFEDADNWEKYVEAYNIMAEIYTWLTDNENLKRVAERARAIGIKQLGQTHPHVGLANMYIGFYHYNHGRAKIAWNYYQRALDISIKALGKKHPQIADIYIKRNFCFYERGEIDSALADLKNAEKIYLEAYGLIHPQTAHSYDCFGFIYYFMGDYDEAIRQALKGLNLKRKVLRVDHPDFTMNFNNLGMFYIQKGDYNKGLEYLLLIPEILKKNYGVHHEHLERSYNNIGYCYGKKGDYDKQLFFAEKALEIQIVNYGEGQPGIEEIYHNMAACYNKKGNYEKAQIYLEKSLPLMIKSGGPDHRNVASAYNQLGNVLSNKKEYKKAQDCYEKEYTIISKIHGEQHPEVAMAIHNLGKSYENAGSLEQALVNYQKALKIRLKVFEEAHPEVADNYEAIGSIYLAKGDHKQAIQFFQKTLEIRLKVLGTKHPEIATSYNHIGEIHLIKKNWVPALESFQEALKCLIPDFQDAQFESNPNLKNVGSKLILLRTLERKAFALHQMWSDSHSSPGKKQQSTSKLKLSLDTYQIAIGLIDSIRLGFNLKASRQELADSSMPLYQRAIRVSNELYKVTQNPDYLEQAFQIVEKSKAFILLEALKDAETKKFAGIPDSLVDYQESLSLDLTFFEQQLMEAKLKKDTARAELYRDYLFKGRREFDKLIKKMERNYPKYYQLKYNVNVASVRNIQKQLLDKNTSLVEYFVGDSSIFVFLVKPNDFQLYEINRNFPLEEWVRQLRKGTYFYQMSGINDQSTYLAYSDTFALASYQLYKKLISPFKAQLSEKLIIIPDGVLNFIPFETLISQQPKESHHFKSHNYLLKQHQISYSFSGTLLEKMSKKKSNATKKLLAFAPSFDESNPSITDVEIKRSELGVLAHNISEVAQINAIIDGDVYIGDEATEENFTRLAEAYQILHLATHGKANDKIGDYSYLAFTEIKDSIENEFLYVRDLYNLKLNAEMVVLSACESGIGELQRGEGVISLARGFSYAGAKSILTTLWSVNDKETKKLMESFYLNIKAGMGKDEALHNAKLDFINNRSHHSAHPFYWAAFVPLGNMEPIYKEQLTVPSRHL